MKKLSVLLIIINIFIVNITYSTQDLTATVRKKDILNVEKIKKKYLDISYSNLSLSQKLDIYFPDKEKTRYPVIIFIHGGAWLSGDKRENFSIPILRALKEGYAVVSINYRLSNEAIFPAAIEDVKTAIRYIRKNAFKYALDDKNMALWGRSSGGNLALLAGVTGNSNKFGNNLLKNISSAVKAVVAWFPPIDLLTMDLQLKELGIKGQSRGLPINENTSSNNDNDWEVHNKKDSPASLYMGNKISLVPKLVNENNPTFYLGEQIPHIFIEHGTKDNVVPITQSRNFVKILKEKSKNKVEYLEIENAKHGGAEFNTKENLDKIFNFLNSILK